MHARAQTLLLRTAICHHRDMLAVGVVERSVRAPAASIIYSFVGVIVRLPPSILLERWIVLITVKPSDPRKELVVEF